LPWAAQAERLTIKQAAAQLPDRAWPALARLVVTGALIMIPKQI
jgi:hypothetical protein